MYNRGWKNTSLYAGLLSLALSSTTAVASEVGDGRYVGIGVGIGFPASVSVKVHLDERNGIQTNLGIAPVGSGYLAWAVDYTRYMGLDIEGNWKIHWGVGWVVHRWNGLQGRNGEDGRWETGPRFPLGIFWLPDSAPIDTGFLLGVALPIGIENDFAMEGAWVIRYYL